MGEDPLLASGPTSLGAEPGRAEIPAGCVPMSSLFIRSPHLPGPEWEQSWELVGVAHCLRIASAPPGRLALEPVAIVTTRLQTSEKDVLVAGCGFLSF